MTTVEFILNHYGTGVEFDGVAPYQCVDLIKSYLKQVHGISPGSWGDAKYYFYNFDKKSWGGYSAMSTAFTKIPNTPDLVPALGDICVFDGTHGHVSIAVGIGNTSRFLSLDQNVKGAITTIEEHRYQSDRFLGVLRPKKKK